MSREAKEEDPSDDEWEKSESDEIEEEVAEAERCIDELEKEFSRIQMMVNENCQHCARLPCIAHKVILIISSVRHTLLPLPQCESVHLL